MLFTFNILSRETHNPATCDGDVIQPRVRPAAGFVSGPQLRVGNAGRPTGPDHNTLLRSRGEVEMTRRIAALLSHALHATNVVRAPAL